MNKELKTAFTILFILIIMLIALTILKFCYVPIENYNENTNNNEVNSLAINKALTEITNNFNELESVDEYEIINNIKMEAILNNYSLFISYSDTTRVTYEFYYDNLTLSILINEDINYEVFRIVYKNLIKAVQLRLKNTYDASLIDKYLDGEIENVNGLSREKVKENTKYIIDITKKIK